jgi:hypothetical protein
LEQRKIESEAEARALLAKVAKSGGDVGAWARAHGIDGRSLNAWRMNLERRGATGRGVVARPRTGAQRAQLVELVPTSISSVPRVARYSLRVGGVEIEFGDDFREETLARALGVLRRC